MECVWHAEKTSEPPATGRVTAHGYCNPKAKRMWTGRLIPDPYTCPGAAREAPRGTRGTCYAARDTWNVLHVVRLQGSPPAGRARSRDVLPTTFTDADGRARKRAAKPHRNFP